MHGDHDLDRKRSAAALFAEGVTRAEVARRLGVSRATTTRWFRAWTDGGADALEAGARRGRPPKLEDRDLTPIQRALTGPPRASGFELDRWSLAAVVALVERHTGVAYHPRHVSRVLRRWGWVVPPVGPHAALAFREREHEDPDGNPIRLREGIAGGPGDPVRNRTRRTR